MWEQTLLEMIVRLYCSGPAELVTVTYDMLAVYRMNYSMTVSSLTAGTLFREAPEVIYVIPEYMILSDTGTVANGKKLLSPIFASLTSLFDFF